MTDDSSSPPCKPVSIALAVITGNAEQYVERFLAHWKHLTPEIAMVRAIGNQQPDNTKVIAERHGVIVTDYENQNGLDWPHVDNFAAARQMAANYAYEWFDADWLVWADMDDIITPESCANLRRYLESTPPDQAGLLIAYDVRDDGVVNMRERAWRPGTARWKGVVHEVLDFGEGKALLGMVPQKDVSVIHAPIHDRAPNNERNLRLLESIPEGERTLSDRFHLVNALHSMGENERSAIEAMALYKEPGLGNPEALEMLFKVASITEDAAQRKALHVQAAAHAPWRREAFGDLAMDALLEGDVEAAKGWIRCMKAQPAPAGGWPWNARRKYWTWMGTQLEAMVQRAAGDYAAAEVLERNAMVETGLPIVTLCHATRGRHKQAYNAWQTWMRLANHPERVEHIFGVDADDPSAEPLALYRAVFCQPGGGCVRAWNEAYAAASGEYCVQMSDDFTPPQGWDDLICDAFAAEPEKHVLRVSDGIRTDKLITIAIVRKAGWRGPLFHPAFTGVFSDNWFTMQADARGTIIERPEVVFRHDHPIVTGAALDETYANQNSDAAYRRGRSIFVRLWRGKLTSWEISGWCDYRDFYTGIARWLLERSKENWPQRVVEVGSYLGQSVVHLAHAFEDECGPDDTDNLLHIYAIENGVGEVTGENQNIIERLKENVKSAATEGSPVEVFVLSWDSTYASERFTGGSPLDFIFIDASHDEASVAADLAAWYPLLAEDGIIAGHDIDSTGVAAAVKAWAEKEGLAIKVVGRVWVAEKRQKTEDVETEDQSHE
jgi:predicted O-methyltransferase YrrM